MQPPRGADGQGCTRIRLIVRRARAFAFRQTANVAQAFGHDAQAGAKYQCPSHARIFKATADLAAALAGQPIHTGPPMLPWPHCAICPPPMKHAGIPCSTTTVPIRWPPAHLPDCLSSTLLSTGGRAWAAATRRPPRSPRNPSILFRLRDEFASPFQVSPPVARRFPAKAVFPHRAGAPPISPAHSAARVESSWL